jgi:pyridoxamine 5'-phosphate oxidase
MSTLRVAESHSTLPETFELDANPYVQFQRWYDEALAAQVPEPFAMNLATATPSGMPSARMVLMRGHDERGFMFYSNYESRKGGELEANPFASLVFYWQPMQRQIRIEGRVEKATAAESDAYFASRPAGHRIAAWASDQSRIIASREALVDRIDVLERQFEGQDVPRPPYWGGYRVIPFAYEFWQGRANRVHDRLRYDLQTDGCWASQRLAP